MADVVTVREAVQRAKSDGLPISEYTLRQWIRNGKVPHRQAGTKVLIYYPNLVEYLKGGDQPPATPAASGIRRIEP